jgi:hypothetical protein
MDKKRTIISIFCIFFCSIHLFAIDWTTITLKGSVEYHTFSKDTKIYSDTYSFIARKIANSGEISFHPTVDENGHYNFGLYGNLAFLGKFIEAPSKISEPSKDKYNYSNRAEIGEYYLLKMQPNIYVLLQICDAQIDNFKRSGLGILGYVYYLEATLKFMYIMSDKGIEAINNILSAQAPQIESIAEPAVPVISAEKPVQDTAKEKDPVSEKHNELDNRYKTLLGEYNIFMELPIEKASVEGCDNLLSSYNALKKEVNDFITELSNNIRDNKSKIASIEEQLLTITDLQIKDRANTKLNNLKSSNSDLNTIMNSWKARLEEICTNIAKLEQYRIILL